MVDHSCLDVSKISNDLISIGLSQILLNSSDLHDDITTEVIRLISAFYGTDESDITLDSLHTIIEPKDLNNLRLHIISRLNQQNKTAKLVYHHTRSLLKSILGFDIAIQKNVGFSIQLPYDSSSLLPLHTDVDDSDCSPHELVIWIPLVKCFGSKSMYYIPFNTHPCLSDYKESINIYKGKTDMESIPNIKSLTIAPPSICLFSHSILHGNTINTTNETRVSLNVRVKNVFTPYRGKRLHDSFIVTELSELSRFFLMLEASCYE